MCLFLISIFSELQKFYFSSWIGERKLSPSAKKVFQTHLADSNFQTVHQ